MTSLLRRPRYRTWASDTVIFAAVFVVVLAITALSDYLNGSDDPPAYLVGLCGAAGSALFGAASSDKSKRDREVSATATRAESKADDALGRSDASMDVALSRVLDVQDRELAANRAALQLMRDAVEVKESSGIPVLPETLVAIAQLEHQTELLSEDIRKRRLEATKPHYAPEEVSDTRTIAKRAEAKVDDLAKFAAKAHPEIADDLPPEDDDNPQVEGEQ
jgi:hypothetical protein